MKPWTSIYAIVPSSHAQVGHYTPLWDRHFYAGLQNTVPVFRTPRDINFTWAFESGISSEKLLRERTQVAEQLRAQIREAHAAQGIDAVVSYARTVEIDPDLVREITALGIPWINFFCDSVGDFESVRDLAAATSLNWFPESQTTSKYRSLGRPVFCRAYAYNSEALPPLASKSRRHLLGFVGMPTQNRVLILGALSVLGCKCAIRGPQWRAGAEQKHSSARWRKLLSPSQLLRAVLRRASLWRLRNEIGDELDDEGFLAFLSECQIILGLNAALNAQGKFESYLKFRDLEMPGYGCCYLTQDNADIRASLEPDREVLLFKSLFEARDKIRFYGTRPELAAQIGAAARRRVLAEHTWPNRLQEIQRTLEN